MTVSVLSNCCYYYYCCYYHQHLQPTKVRVGRVSPGSLSKGSFGLAGRGWVLDFRIYTSCDCERKA